MSISSKFLGLALSLGLSALATGCIVGGGNEAGALDEGAGEAVGEAAQMLVKCASGYAVYTPPSGQPCGTQLPIVWTAPSGHSANDRIAIHYAGDNGVDWGPHTTASSTYVNSTATVGVVYLPVWCSSPKSDDPSKAGWRVEYWLDPGPYYNYQRGAVSAEFTVALSTLTPGFKVPADSCM